MVRPTRSRYEGMRVFISHRYSRRPRALHRLPQQCPYEALRSREVHAQFRLGAGPRFDISRKEHEREIGANKREYPCAGDTRAGGRGKRDK